VTRDEVIALLRSADPLAAARVASVPPGGAVTYSRAAAPAEWLVDGDEEGDIAAHRAAHAAGRPSEASVRYGAGVSAGHTADRLLALAALSEETGMLRAVCPVPGEGSSARPGSWGVEDLVVIAAARAVLPGVPWIRPHWRRLGPAAAQVSVAFGATDWCIPEGDDTDPAHLATAVGRTAVAR
jgi:2-iminoacetate synthase ThiH